jgi:tetratricopeptide (TPR) repeat protein/putative methionine-R-sulfoxide reductase with GAF domain
MIESVQQAFKLFDPKREPPTWLEISEAVWLASHIKIAGRSSLETSVGRPFPEQRKEAIHPAIERKAVDKRETAAEWVLRKAKNALPRFQRKSQNETVDVHAAPKTGVESSASRKGPAFYTPGAPALPGAAEIGRAIRRLRMSYPSRQSVLIDEAATVDRISETGVWTPVLRPIPERYLQAAVVVDQSKSMAIWKQTGIEFVRLLERHGAFRDVRSWSILCDDNGAARLHSGLTPPWPQASSRNVAELADPSGRQLILIVTDCVSPAWHSGSMLSVLRLWGRTCPVTIVQVLPDHLWSRTALGPNTVGIHSRHRAQPNSKYALINDYDRLVRVPDGTTAIPVVRLDSASLASWAQFISGGSSLVTGSLFPSGLSFVEKDLAERKEAMWESSKAQILLERFDGTATKPARQLAAYLSLVPLTFPIMRLVQRVMLPESRQAHLAEVYLSGLIREDGNGALQDATQMSFEFVPTLREALQKRILRPEQLRVLNEVSRYIEIMAGQRGDIRSTSSRRIASPDLPSHPLSLPFARIRADVLRKLGGAYASEAERLEASVKRVDESLNENRAQVLSPVDSAAIRNRLIEALRKMALTEADAIELSHLSPEYFAQEFFPCFSGFHDKFDVLLKLLEGFAGIDYSQVFVNKRNELVVQGERIVEGKARYSIASWSGIVGTAAKTKRSIYAPNVQEGPDYYIAAERTTRSEFAVPITGVSDDLIAVVNLESSSFDAFPVEQRGWISRFLRTAASVLQEPRVFLSCAVDDGKLARHLPHDLRRDGLDVSVSSEDAKSLGDWLGGADDVECNDCFIALLSPRYIGSEAADELALELARRGEDGRPILLLPAVLEPCIPPRFLREAKLTDLHTDYRAGYTALLDAIQRTVSSWPNQRLREREAPEDIGGVLGRVSELVGQEEYDSAIHLLDDVLENDPLNPTLLRNRGWAHWYGGHHSEALADYNKMAQKGTSFERQILSVRGQVLAEMGDWEPAIHDLTRAIELAKAQGDLPTEAYSRNGRGLAYGLAGDYQRAMEDFSASIAACPENSWVYYSRGRIYEKQGDSARALLDYERSLELRDPPLNAPKRLFVQDRLVALIGRLAN